jgi:hypothetical protein
LLPNKQFVALELIGEPQSGKTTTQNALLSLIDPTFVNCGIPKTDKDFDKLLLLNKYVVDFDNLDSLSKATQKKIAELLSGYVSEQNYLFKCPVIFNAIDSVVTESILSDLTITIDISNERFLSSPTDDPLQYLRSDIFAWILKAIHYVYFYNGYLNENVSRSPKMQDFCRTGILLARMMDRSQSEFSDQFSANQKTRLQLQLDNLPVGLAIQSFLAANQDSQTTHLPVSKWLEVLENYKPDGIAKADWPSNPKMLGAALKRVAPLLRKLEIRCVSQGKTGSNCEWEIMPQPKGGFDISSYRI